MRRGLTYLFVFLLIVSLAIVSSQDAEAPTDDADVSTEGDDATVEEEGDVSEDKTSVDSREQQYEDIKEKIDLIPKIIDPETGEVNRTTLKIGLSAADEKIAEINKWLADNASWLKFVFGMIPEISWGFAWIIFWTLLFFTYIVLNAASFFPFFQEEINARIFGGSIFAIMLALRIFYAFAVLTVSVLDIFFNYVLPWGFVIAIVLTIGFIIFLIFGGWAIMARLIPVIIRILGRIMGQKIISAAGKNGGDIQKIAKEGAKEVEKLKTAREIAEARQNAIFDAGDAGEFD